MSALSQAASRALSAPAEGIRAIAAALRMTALLTLAAVTLAGAYMTWGRDLPLFNVSSVEVVGTDDGLIVSTLTQAARAMTTLHVSQERFDQLAANFPAVAGVSAEPDFPTGMRVVVDVREPVAHADVGDRAIPVAADGTLLPGEDAPRGLPTIDADAKGPTVIGEAVDQLRVIGATPQPLLELVRGVETRKEGGIAIELEGGVEVRFGTPTGAERKWAAAAAVIADGTLSSLTYVDVSAPERPAVGGAVGGPEVAVDSDPAVQATVSAPEANEETAPIAPAAIP